MIRAVFFDLYNTLVGHDPPREELEAKALNEFGIKVEAAALRRPLLKADEFFFEENARARINDRPKEAIQSIYAQYQAVLLTEAGIEPSRELIGGIMRQWQQVNFKQVLYDDVLPTLKELKERDYILGLISNIDSDIVPLLNKLKLAPLLEIIVTSLETGYTKPHPTIFNEALKRAHVVPPEAMFVGDQYKIDVVGAANVGMQGVLIDRYNHFEEDSQYLRIQNLFKLMEHLP